MNRIPAGRSEPLEEVRGFVDILATSESWPAAPQDPATADGYLANRRRLPLPPGPVTVERTHLAAGASGECILPGEEFVLVLVGGVTLQQSGVRLELTAGEAAVAVRDRPLAWRSAAGASLVLMRCTAGGGEGAEAPVRIDQAAPLAPSNPPAADVLLGPTPECHSHADYRSASGEFICGVWDSTPYHRRVITFRHYELMRLLDGSVTFVDAAGREGRFRAGDVVLLEQGGGASWESREYVRKIYSTFRPAA